MNSITHKPDLTNDIERMKYLVAIHKGFSNSTIELLQRRVRANKFTDAHVEEVRECLDIVRSRFEATIEDLKQQNMDL